MYKGVLATYMSVHHMHAVSKKTRRGQWIPWSRIIDKHSTIFIGESERLTLSKLLRDEVLTSFR